jgi:hypothetical protein
MRDVDNTPIPDDAPEADVAEQRLEVGPADSGLDTSHVEALGDREANPADVVDQAIVVPDPEDGYDST